MNRKQAFWASAVLALTLGFSACTKKAEQSTESQPASANGTQANATQPNTNAPANSAAAPTPNRNVGNGEAEPEANGNAMAPATNGNTQTANGNTPATVTPGASPMASSPIGTGRVPMATPRSAAAAPTPAPVPVITLPAGTAIAVHMDNPISTKTAENGQGFEASVAQAVTRNGETVIPVGARAAGTVTNAAQAGRFKGGAQLGLRLTRVTIKGQTYDVSTSSLTMSSKARGKRTAIVTGGGAAVGALIGGLAGGGKGALIGTLAGGGAGAAGSAMTGQRDISLPAEALLTFKLSQPVTVK